MGATGGVLWWSHTRDRTLRECPRRYYYQYHAAAGGWRSDAPPLVHRAFALRCLTTLDLLLGTEVHARAQEIGTQVCAGIAIPGAGQLRHHTRSALAAVWRRRSVPTFLRDPAGHPMLLGFYYQRGIGGRETDRIRQKLMDCHDNLVRSPVWAEVAPSAGSEVFTVDSLASFLHKGIRVLVAPDLIFRSGATLMLVDWKTGSAPDAREQMALYALFARETLKVPFTEGSYCARVVDLTLGEEVSWNVTSTDLVAAEERIREGALRIRSYHRDPAGRLPLPIRAFPLTRQRWRCSHCPFWEFCAAELQKLPTADREPFTS